MDRKLTVLHLLPDLFSKGGTPRKLLTLVQGCEPEKISHVFLLFNDCQDSLAPDAMTAGATVLSTRRPRAFDLRLLWDIRSAIRAYGVDVVNTHFARSDIFGLIVGRLCGKPVIKSVHGIVWSPNRILRVLDRWLAAGRYLTICNSRASELAERRRSGVDRTVVVHNGVKPLDGFPAPEERARLRASLGVAPDAFVVGHVGGLIALRKHHVILEAIRRLANQVPEVVFILAGDGPERADLEARIHAAGMERRVKLLGYRTDVAALVSIMDGYVNVATEEGFGSAVVEAMLAGVPVVLADAGALPELAVDGESGILVPPDDPGQLAAAFVRLADDPGLAARIGAGGMRKAQEEFSESRFCNDLAAIYLDAGRLAH